MPNMPTPEELARVRTSHEMWKVRLKTGIHIGRLNLKPTEFADSKTCEFGQWLVSLPPEERDSERVRRIEEIHRIVHERASRAYELVLAGRKREAERSLLGGGEFDYLSQELLDIMISWEEECAGAGQAPQ